MLSIVPLVGLGMVLSTTVHRLIEDRYLTTYARSADVTIASVTGLVMADPALEAKVLEGAPKVVSAMVDGLQGLVAYAPDGTVNFAEQGVSLPRRAQRPALVRAAFASGQPSAKWTESLPPYVHLAAPAVELAIPVHYERSLIGVVHAYGSGAEVQAGISSGVRRANLELVVGLGVLWLLLFPIVVSASRRLRRQALYDSLTGLANRDLFADRFAQAMAAAQRRGEKVGLLLLDLDRFKEVNDGLGHQHGDQLLREVAAALSAQVRGSDTLARLGGDEFAVVLTGIRTEEQGLAAAERLTRALEIPVSVDGVAVTPQASVGLSLYPDHGTDADSLLGKADMAMYAAKSGRHSVTAYSPDRDFSVPARLGLVAELRRALAEGEIICHYQPLAHMVDRQVWGVEALVRWAHPDRGLLGPGEFLPVIEQAGLIGPMTERVLEVALAECRNWLEDGLDLVVAVNLSARSLRDPGLPDMVFAALDAAGIPPTNLELEITEDALLEDPAQAKVLLETLAGRGVRISLDDFGTGYSSLAYLSQLPVNKVKIDRAFLAGLDADDMNEKIVETVIDLGRRLGMDVLAEGVETAEVWERLVQMGCPQAQGYYLARPMPAEEVAPWRNAYDPTLAKATV